MKLTFNQVFSRFFMMLLFFYLVACGKDNQIRYVETKQNFKLNDKEILKRNGQENYIVDQIERLDESEDENKYDPYNVIRGNYEVSNVWYKNDNKQVTMRMNIKKKNNSSVPSTNVNKDSGSVDFESKSIEMIGDINSDSNVVYLNQFKTDEKSNLGFKGVLHCFDSVQVCKKFYLELYDKKNNEFYVEQVESQIDSPSENEAIHKDEIAENYQLQYPNDGGGDDKNDSNQTFAAGAALNHEQFVEGESESDYETEDAEAIGDAGYSSDHALNISNLYKQKFSNLKLNESFFNVLGSEQDGVPTENRLNNQNNNDPNKSKNGNTFFSAVTGFLGQVVDYFNLNIKSNKPNSIDPLTLVQDIRNQAFGYPAAFASAPASLNDNLNRLENGINLVELEKSNLIKFRSKSSNEAYSRTYGTSDAALLIANLANWYVGSNLGDKLSIGDVAQKYGHKFLHSQHKSHRNGLDVDIDIAGVKQDGQFDAKSNLLMLLKANQSARISFVMFDKSNFNKMCNFAKTNYGNASQKVKDFMNLTFKKLNVDAGNNHRTHFHFRNACDNSRHSSCKEPRYRDYNFCKI